MNSTDVKIRALYAGAAADEHNDFRPHALRQVCEYFGAKAAAWVTHSEGGTVGEFSVFPRNLAASAEQLLQTQVKDDGPSALAADGSRPHGLAFRHQHLNTGLTSTVAFWFAANKKFSEPAAAAQLVGHMVESAVLALQQFIARDERLAHMGRPSRGATALVDASGTLYAASETFLDLVKAEFNLDKLGKLPFTLPDDVINEDGLFEQGNLRFRSSRQGGLYILHARQPQPLDSLSAREQQIARALGRGKTFKSVARQCGIAVSTVANHASRIYRKLGIYRREDLVEIVRAPHTGSDRAN